MPNEKRPLKVFLCHAHDDKAQARELYRFLKRRGLQPWLDAEDLLPGQAWQVEIPKALETSDAIIILLSQTSVDKEGYVQKEIKFALDKALEMPEGRIFIIPARLDACNVPRSLSGYHWVDLCEQGGYDKLLKSLRERAKQLERFNIATKDEQEQQLRLKDAKVIVPLITAVLFAITLLIGTLLQGINPAPALTATNTITSTAAATSTHTPTATFTNLPPSETPTPSLTPEPSPTPTKHVILSPTPLSTLIIDSKNIPMALVPEGPFWMGSNNKDYEDENPLHNVNLSAFYIDIYEVTNESYAKCATAATCLPPVDTRSRTRPNYYGTEKYADYPVIYVNWNMAKTYCEWRGGRLPTEAEWEKAARSSGGSTYPWGEKIDSSYANYNNYIGDTTPVGNYEKGKSVYGIYDMVGNVQEWVNDWWLINYYKTLTENTLNPQGPKDGTQRVVRGGTWTSGTNFVRTTWREQISPTGIADHLGFRCARDAKP